MHCAICTLTKLLGGSCFGPMATLGSRCNGSYTYTHWEETRKQVDFHMRASGMHLRDCFQQTQTNFHDVRLFSGTTELGDDAALAFQMKFTVVTIPSPTKALAAIEEAHGRFILFISGGRKIAKRLFDY